MEREKVRVGEVFVPTGCCCDSHPRMQVKSNDPVALRASVNVLAYYFYYGTFYGE